MKESTNMTTHLALSKQVSEDINLCLDKLKETIRDIVDLLVDNHIINYKLGAAIMIAVVTMIGAIKEAILYYGEP